MTAALRSAPGVHLHTHLYTRVPLTGYTFLDLLSAIYTLGLDPFLLSAHSDLIFLHTMGN